MIRSCVGLLRTSRFATALAATIIVSLAAATPSQASSPSPHWSIASESQPTYFKAGDASEAYALIVRNDGGTQTTKGSPVTITDSLPKGVTAKTVIAISEGPNGRGSPTYELACPITPGAELVACTYEEGPTNGPILAGATIVVTITVAVPEGAQALDANSATVSGGGAPSASTSEVTPLSGEIAPFGLSLFDVETAGENGEADKQAGSHPFELTTSFAFNVAGRESPSTNNNDTEWLLASAAPKDVEVALPPGLVGDPNALPQCSQQAFLEGANLNCPVDTQVGTVRAFFYGSFPSANYPVYNLVPPAGAPAELGFSVSDLGRVTLFFHVRSGGNYGLTASLDGIPETGPLQGAILTLWGVPAAASHDLEREGTLGDGAQGASEFCKPAVKFKGGEEIQTLCPSDAPAKPFLTLPSQCQPEGPFTATVDSWESPGQLQTYSSPEPGTANEITGCEQLAFTPSLTLTPETTQADTPSGYTIELHVPQNENPVGLATPDLRNAVVSLPAGIVVSPSATNGLQGCSQAQFAAGPSSAASCPPRSQIGTVKIATPLLSSPLEGQVFLAEPECAPCTPAQAQEGRLVRLLVQAQGSGVTVKLEGATSIDQSTGQLTVSFANAPQLPFEDLKLTLDGGSRAPLANTSTCGVPLAASSSLTPYSSETPAQPSSEPFELSGCPPPQFHPSFVAGTTNNQAGAFSPLTVTLSRTDQDEQLQALTVHLPPGLLGMIAKVSLCAEAQAKVGACEAESEIGSATVGAGPGASPVYLAGRVYLTGPYEGAPFGLSIVVPAVAGPFNLGTIDVGARIEVDPKTAALTISSDPLPQRLDGIPLQLKTVNLDIDRAGFTFNPTDCEPLVVEGSAQSSEGATALLSSRFQAANCATLPFKPRLGALTHAKTSKAGGAYLHVRLESAPGEANIAKLKVDVPKQLPVRLTTLQKACTAPVIEANPANCPAASVVGSVTVLTPVLRNALVGPVYLVSHGGAASPELEFVLQGEGVTVDVIGQTIIEHGIISAAFRTLPDVPISTLGVVLNAGPHSLLAANLPTIAKGSICGQRLTMPVAITGQNGAVVKQTVAIGVSGCPRHQTTKHRPVKRGVSGKPVKRRVPAQVAAQHRA
ncbi:MAG: hypothetical protein ABR992_09810 [Solirubrobacteraceae bacterium]|jgi:hypothetical protein